VHDMDGLSQEDKETEMKVQPLFSNEGLLKIIFLCSSTGIT